MSEPITSRLPGFHGLSMEERRERLASMVELGERSTDVLAGGGISPGVANAMVENAIGVFALPMAVGLNLVVNGREYLVPMVIEEPSVVAAFSLAAKLARGAGGFTAEADEPLMIGQIQVAEVPDLELASRRVQAAREEILALANSFHPKLVARGGGARDLEVRLLLGEEAGTDLLVVHLLIDTREAMGANLINTAAEGVAPLIEELTGGKVQLRILSNLADQRRARARCAIPLAELGAFGLDGAAVAKGVAAASRFAEMDPYRAATHNKGVMNGIDAVAIATGQDWRAIEAGAHAYACRSGQYKPLSRWWIEGDRLHGSVELPMAVGTVGGPILIHGAAQLGLKLLGGVTAKELAMVIAAAGLAQNFAALRALGSVGIQRGHMALHARSLAATAGAQGDEINVVAKQLVAGGEIKLARARELLEAARPPAVDEALRIVG